MNKNATALKDEQKKAQGTENVQPFAVEVIKTPTIEELQAKGLKIYHLTQRYEEIRGKKALVDRFQILHEKENACLTIVDAKGEEITTNNPKSIQQVIEIWKCDLTEALSKAETEIRQIMSTETQPVTLEKAA
jgi:hypothetical protein